MNRDETGGGPRIGSSTGTGLAARLRCVVRIGYRPAVLVADLRHFLDLPDGTPALAVRLAEQLQDIVRAATAGEAEAGWVSALPCGRRPGNRRCPGRILVRRTEPAAPITWECIMCRDTGSVSGWRDTPYLSRRLAMSSGPARHISISDDVAVSLRKTMLLDTDGERVVYGARSDGVRVTLTATDEQLEELLGSLAAEANHETNRRRRLRLAAAYDELRNPVRALAPQAATPAGSSGGPRDTPPAECSPPTSHGSGLPELDVDTVDQAR